jgi:hypothetical protein
MQTVRCHYQRVETRVGRTRAMLRPFESPDVFISYSWNDSQVVLPFAELLRESLHSKGVVVFFDKRSRPQQDRNGLRAGLASGLSTARVFLPCASQNYLQSRWCVEELSAFFWRYLAEHSVARTAGQPSGVRLRSSGLLYCLPLVLGSDEPHEALRDLTMLQVALVRECRDGLHSIRSISAFLATGRKLVHRANLGPKELARQVGSHIQDLLEATYD